MDKLFRKYKFLCGIRPLILACDNPYVVFDETIGYVVLCNNERRLYGDKMSKEDSVEDLRRINNLILMWKSEVDKDEDPTNPT